MSERDLKQSASSPAVVLDKQADVPLYQQIYEFFKEGIVQGAYRPGDKLPSIRALASRLGVARNTIDSAYKQLTVEGYVKSRRGSGYLVQETSRGMLAELPQPEEPTLPKEAGEPALPDCRYDFCYGDLLEGIFPMETWKRLSNEVLAKDHMDLFAHYHDWQGSYALRTQIARHLKRMRDIDASPEQIVVTSGTQRTIELILGLFDPAHDTVACDDPGYPGAHSTIRSCRFGVDRLRTDQGDAAFISDIEKSEARLFYTTPSHQFPMGWCMNQDVRSQLLKVAVEKDAYILEDDYDSGYRYTAQPVPSLASLDKWGRVIYLGTFSKVLSPALRISYAVLPGALMARLDDRCRSMRSTVPELEQEVLARFMEQGYWERHLRRTILGYRKRYQLLMQTLEETFDGDVRVHDGEAGLFVLLEVRNGMEQDELVKAAADKGVRIYGTKRYWLDPDDAPDNLVLLGFSAASADTIICGIPLLKHAWFPEKDKQGTNS
ncbi:MAG: PLP-dependent aminotransferase family protein [Coriobacteriales bacterium]|jgi:GntR family transcriptional regulator/MocR family aminotransferase